MSAPGQKRIKRGTKDFYMPGKRLMLNRSAGKCCVQNAQAGSWVHRSLFSLLWLVASEPFAHALSDCFRPVWLAVVLLTSSIADVSSRTTPVRRSKSHRALTAALQALPARDQTLDLPICRLYPHGNEPISPSVIRKRKSEWQLAGGWWVSVVTHPSGRRVLTPLPSLRPTCNVLQSQTNSDE